MRDSAKTLSSAQTTWELKDALMRSRVLVSNIQSATSADSRRRGIVPLLGFALFGITRSASMNARGCLTSSSGRLRLSP